MTDKVNMKVASLLNEYLRKTIFISIIDLSLVILRDKSMDDKLMFNLKIIECYTIQENPPKFLTQRMKERVNKSLGTSVIYSLISPPYLPILVFTLVPKVLLFVC